MWKNLELQFKKKKNYKMSACEVLEPNLEHTLEIRTAASKPGPTCLMNGEKTPERAQSRAKRAPTEGLLNCLPGCIIFIGGLFIHKAK